MTNDHLFAALANRSFGLKPAEYTPHHVAMWSMENTSAARFEVWSKQTDPALLEQFYSWVETRLGTLGPVLVAVWRSRDRHNWYRWVSSQH